MMPIRKEDLKIGGNIIMTKKSNRIITIPVLLALLLLVMAVSAASAATSATIRAYGEDDVGPGTDEDDLINPVQGPLAPNVYDDPDDSFEPQEIPKDSITFNPAIIPWDGTVFKMSADSLNIDLKKYLRIWYEPNHTFNGQLDNPTRHPTIEIETTYILLDSKHKKPVTGHAGMTRFAFPIAEKAGQIGLGSFDANGDGVPDLVELAKVEDGPGTTGTIRIEQSFNLGIGEQVQFLDHKLKFVGVYTDPSNSNIKYAKAEISYAGNLEDDSAKVVDLRPDRTFFDRHNNIVHHEDHPDATWYAKFIAFNGQRVQLIVGKEISAGDTFYVNSVRYDVPAVFCSRRCQWSSGRNNPQKANDVQVHHP